MSTKTLAIVLAFATAICMLSCLSFAEEVPADIADMKVDERFVGDEQQKRYFVIQHPVEPPAEGWRVLFVLPGGSGSADFRPFITRIAKNSVPKTYLVVQLVAPVWSPKQAEQIVWPTGKLTVPEAKFTTEDFFLAVREEVAKSYKLDSRYCFTLTWSSSGSNGYGLSLTPKSGITGSFVAMSVFKPDLLPPLDGAKGLPYYLFHSPQDFIPIAHPRAAEKALTDAGAIVKLQTYEGGHGWKGNIFQNIRDGIDWLESEAERQALPID